MCDELRSCRQMRRKLGTGNCLVVEPLYGMPDIVETYIPLLVYEKSLLAILDDLAPARLGRYFCDVRVRTPAPLEFGLSSCGAPTASAALEDYWQSYLWFPGNVFGPELWVYPAEPGRFYVLPLHALSDYCGDSCEWSSNFWNKNTGHDHDTARYTVYKGPQKSYPSQDNYTNGAN